MSEGSPRDAVTAPTMSAESVMSHASQLKVICCIQLPPLAMKVLAKRYR